ncbi:MAG: hypothetical protein RIC55_07465 [Pirellulaceae bacterium]
MHLKRIGLTAVLSMIASWAGGPGALAETPAEKPEVEGDASSFVRLLRDEAGEPVAFETAVARYVPADGKNEGLTVDLIAAVHVGDKKYYDRLNESFKAYDALLYELVAREEDVPKRDKEGRLRERPGFSVIMALQQGVKSVLELEHQLSHINYEADNFVHADMTPAEFNRSMRDRKESFFSMFLRMMKAQLETQQGGETMSDAEVIAMLLSKDRAVQMKRAFAEQIEDLDGGMAALEGPEGSTIITERNKKALEVLDREIKAGKQRIGIFYGAGHLADMEKRLAEEFGLKKDKQQWLEAWNLRLPAEADKEMARKKSPLEAALEALLPKP